MEPQHVQVDECGGVEGGDSCVLTRSHVCTTTPPPGSPGEYALGLETKTPKICLIKAFKLTL